MKYPQLVSCKIKWFTRSGFFVLAALFANVQAAGLEHNDVTSIDAECLAIEQAFAGNQVQTLSQLTVVSPRWQALRAFRLAAIYIPLNDKARARQAVREGLLSIRTGLDDVAQRAESAGGDSLLQTQEETELLLLGAMLDGQFLLIDRWRLLRNGWRGLRRLQRAEKLDQENTRATLVRGTAKVVAPWALGGSAEEAVRILERADLSQPLCASGEWAQVDVLNWLGRAHSELANQAEAKAAYEAALARSPNNHWVRLALAGEGYRWTEHGE